LIHAEVDWINYLAEGGAPVARAITSRNGEIVEPINDGHGARFLAVAFEKAPGTYPSEVGWSPEGYARYGRLIGRIHALSQNYRPSNPVWKRPEWNDPEIMDIAAHLPPGEEAVLQKLDSLVAHLNILPRSPDCFGMIHFDAHSGNMFMDSNGKLTLFDFDDCCYGWYIYDIAILLFYMVMGEQDVARFINAFMGAFLLGYTKEKKLEPDWLDEIPYFLKLREIDLYAVIHRSFDVDNLDDPWCTRYMYGRKERLLAGRPYVEFDFSNLRKYL
jgi:Ser/Thr protein kinase RdoA (MazF antagonist)